MPVSPQRALLVTGALIAMQIALSVVLCFAAYFGQMAFGTCGYPVSPMPCNYALGTFSLYAFIAIVIVVFAAVVALVARAHARHTTSWRYPVLGSAIALLGYVIYILLMLVATQ